MIFGRPKTNIGNCTALGCDRKQVCKSYCDKHYRIFKLRGNPIALLYLKNEGSCSVEGCSNISERKTVCGKHYRRLQRNGTMEITKEMHGLSKLPEYSIWCGIISRCENPNGEFAYCYIEKGIKICKKWRTSFLAFYADMGTRPSKKHQIDRIDNKGNYSPKNCRWVTASVNVRNSTIAKLNENQVREIRNSEISCIKTAKIYKVSRTTISRIRKGLSWNI